jgi:hypothetical protein
LKTPFDELVADPQFAREIAKTLMTLNRRDHKPPPGWPPKVQVCGRNHRWRSDIEAYKATLPHYDTIADDDVEATPPPAAPVMQRVDFRDAAPPPTDASAPSLRSEWRRPLPTGARRKRTPQP